MAGVRIALLRIERRFKHTARLSSAVGLLDDKTVKGLDMTRKYAELTFTDSVKRAQEHYGSRQQASRMETVHSADDRLSDREAEFIAGRDGFYVASVGDDGWPYVQFRGGPKGFLKVLDDRSLGFADFRGNRQYITTGNIRSDSRVALFLMDYANRKRLKIMARAEIFDIGQKRRFGRGILEEARDGGAQ